MNVPLNLRQLACFVEAAEAGSMARAAEGLHVSAPAVSQAIAQLEGALDVQLFIRRPSVGLTLTPAGRGLLAPAKELLTHAEDVRVTATALGAPIAGQLIVGCFKTAAPFLLPELHATFAREHPEVQLEFIDGSRLEILAALRQGACEVALIYDLDVEDSIIYEPLFETRHHIVLAPDHPLAGHSQVTVEQLVQHDLVMYEIPPANEAYLERLFAHAGQELCVSHKTVHRELAFALAARGQGYVLVLNCPSEDHSYEGLPLVVRPLRHEGHSPALSLSLARRARVHQTRRARLFAEHCRHVLDPAHGSLAVRRMRGDPE